MFIVKLLRQNYKNGEKMKQSVIISKVIEKLEESLREEPAMVKLQWRYAPEKPNNPMDFTASVDLPEWNAAMWPKLKSREQNWFYAELVFPEEYKKVALADSPVRLSIYGYCPFTLWIDGEELYRESHVWHATGPIMDELALHIESGKVYKLIACFEPTELPVDLGTAESINFNSARWQDITVDVSAGILEIKIAVELAQTAEEIEIIETAVDMVDLNALDSCDWSSVIESISHMEKKLQPFHARAKDITIHLVGHNHIDMDWQWTWKDTEYCMRRDAKSVIDIMDDFPEVTYAISQIPFYQTIKRTDPEIFAKIQQRITEGRWECLAGTWVEGDLNMSDGESIARHMLYAKEWTRETLGVEATTLWEPDTFGHPGNMPQLAKLGEMKHYFHWRCNPGRDNNWPVRIWHGIDGTPIIAFSEAYGGHLSPQGISANLLNYLRWGYTHALHVWGLGDHGGGMPRYFLAMLDRYRDRPLIPKFKFDTMAGMVEAISTERAKFPENHGETYSLFEGCFTTHALLKSYNRRCETALLTAEAVTALAHLDRRIHLRKAWTDMLFNHFHDIFDGAAVHDSYIDAFARAESSLSVAAEVKNEALQVLLAPDVNGSTLTLLNPLGCVRSEPVYVDLPATVMALLDDAGKVIPLQRYDNQAVFIAEQVPAFSRKNYSLLTSMPENGDFSTLSITEAGSYYRIENNVAVSMLHRESGVIGSYYDKILGQEFVAYGVDKTLTHVPCTRKDMAMNLFQVIDESPNRMTAWLINDIVKEENLLRGAETVLLENGPVFARFLVKHSFRSSKIAEEVIYYRDFPRVDFHADIDWQEKGNNEVGIPQLKVSFATATRAARARFDGPFFVPERTADGTEQVTQKYLDISGDSFGFTLLNDSRYGVDALGGRARLTLLRNAYNPDPETDNGQHIVRFAFAPHAPIFSSAKLQEMGMAYNRPILNEITSGGVLPHDANLMIIGNEEIICTAIRMAEYSEDLLVRFFNTCDTAVSVEITLGCGLTAAQEVNFLERPTGNELALQQGRALLDFHPFEVKTLRCQCTWH